MTCYVYVALTLTLTLTITLTLTLNPNPNDLINVTSHEHKRPHKFWPNKIDEDIMFMRSTCS